MLVYKDTSFIWLSSYLILYLMPALICALIPLLMSRTGTIFPDKVYSYEVCMHLNICIYVFFCCGCSCGNALWFSGYGYLCTNHVLLMLKKGSNRLMHFIYLF